MKKLLLLSISLLFFCNTAFAALNAAIVWEVRSDGNSANGGGYKTGATGTDFSQQTSPQYALTGCTTAAADAIILNANAAADMVGNILYIVSGTNFTVGWYEIISVSVGVSITVDRTCTTAAGADGVVNVGGATNHPNTISAVVVAGNDIYIKSGTYQPVGANVYVFSTAVNGTPALPIRFIGYSATRNDTPTGTNRPLFDANSVVGSDVVVITHSDYNWFNLRFANAADDGINANSYSSDRGFFYNCKISNNASDGVLWVEIQKIVNCEINNNTAYGINAGDRQGYAEFTYIHDNGSAGLRGENNISIFARYVVSESNSSHGFVSGGTGAKFDVWNCVAYNNTGAATDGFNVNYSGTLIGVSGIIINCSSISNGRYAYNDVDGYTRLHIFNYNNYYGHATELNGFTAGANDTGDVDPLFTAPTTGDFTLQTGSPCLGTGADANIPPTGLTGDYKLNIGVDQDDVTAAGAGGARGARFLIQ